MRRLTPAAIAERMIERDADGRLVIFSGKFASGHPGGNALSPIRFLAAYNRGGTGDTVLAQVRARVAELVEAIRAEALGQAVRPSLQQVAVAGHVIEIEPVTPEHVERVRLLLRDAGIPDPVGFQDNGDNKSITVGRWSIERDDRGESGWSPWIVRRAAHVVATMFEPAYDDVADVGGYLELSAATARLILGFKADAAEALADAEALSQEAAQYAGAGLASNPPPAPAAPADRILPASAATGQVLMIDDQPITPMPEFCTRWECRVDNKGGRRLVRNDAGFMVCPLCGYSYGRAEPEQPEAPEPGPLDVFTWFA
jgi:hypothetical protein